MMDYFKRFNLLGYPTVNPNVYWIVLGISMLLGLAFAIVDKFK